MRSRILGREIIFLVEEEWNIKHKKSYFSHFNMREREREEIFVNL